MQPLEEREIPGISAKAVIWLVSSVAVIIIAVMGYAFSLKADISSLNNNIIILSKEQVGLRKDIETLIIEKKADRNEIDAIKLVLTRIEATLK